MKKRTKVIGLALAALFAFSAFAAASAQAETWWVNGSTLSSSKAIEGSGGVANLKTSIVNIQCTKSVVSGNINNLSGKAHVTGVRVHYTECMPEGVSTTLCPTDSRYVNDAGTEVTSEAGTITTNKLTGTIVTNTGNSTAHILLKPESGSAFTKIGIGGSECALATEPLEVTGEVEGKLEPNVGVKATSGTVSFPNTPLSGSTLKLGAAKATYSGSDSLKLTSGESFELSTTE